MNKGIFVGLAVLILAIGGYLLYGSLNSSIEKGGDIGAYNEFIENSGEDNFEGVNPNDGPEGPEVSVDGAAPTDPDEVKTFIVTGENFKFFIDGVENPEIKVQKGDRVRIEFESTTGFHDWVIDEFDAATQKVSEGETTFVDFIATETGTFEYYCSVGNHRAQGMKGNFIVE